MGDVEKGVSGDSGLQAKTHLKNERTLKRFYTAFAELDHRSMAECYQANATFRDEVFTLDGRDAIAGMWRMLCESIKGRGKDVWKLVFKVTNCTDEVSQMPGSDPCYKGSLNWEADYRFSATGRMVHNVISASFQFNMLSGLIQSHVDTFDFYLWSKQALGCTGFMLGWTSCFHSKVRMNAGNNLSRFRAKEGPPKRDPPKIILCGPPASGKGTQCEYIKKEFGVVHLSTGDMLRAAVQSGSELGKEAQQFMNSGRLVPDELIIGVVVERLLEKDCVEQGWLLDGFPRSPSQAEAMRKAGISCDYFLQLVVDDSLLIERVVGRRNDPVTGKIYHLKYSPPPVDPELIARLQQRSDDTEEKFSHRIKSYNENLQSIQNNYDSSQIMKFNGNKAPKEVWDDVRAHLISKGEKSMQPSSDLNVGDIKADVDSPLLKSSI